jgi:hypothetical protein
VLIFTIKTILWTPIIIYFCLHFFIEKFVDLRFQVKSLEREFQARFNGGKFFSTTIKEKGLQVPNIFPPKSGTKQEKNAEILFLYFFVYNLKKMSGRFYDKSKFYLLDHWKENFKPDFTVGSFFPPR